MQDHKDKKDSPTSYLDEMEYFTTDIESDVNSLSPNVFSKSSSADQALDRGNFSKACLAQHSSLYDSRQIGISVSEVSVPSYGNKYARGNSNIIDMFDVDFDTY